MDRFIDGIELVAAVFIGIVAADVFLTVTLRYFGIDIPDSYDFGMLLLGILIFWGIGATSYRGAKKPVALLGPKGGPRWRRAFEVSPTWVLWGWGTTHPYCLFEKGWSTN